MAPSVGVVRAIGAEGARAPSGDPVLALDIGGTKLAAGVVDEEGVVHSFVVAPSRAEEGPERTLDRLFELAWRAVAESGVEWEQIRAVGIGWGGGVGAGAGGAPAGRSTRSGAC